MLVPKMLVLQNPSCFLVIGFHCYLVRLSTCYGYERIRMQGPRLHGTLFEFEGVSSSHCLNGVPYLEIENILHDLPPFSVGTSLRVYGQGTGVLVPSNLLACSD